MTQKDKELLLKDLCARLPYDVAVDCRDEVSRFTCYLTSDMLREIQNNNCYWEYKPYLFPLSSMTKEQEEEYNTMYEENRYSWRENIIDWFHKNHLDYRGLIPKGLAIDATGLNIY